MGEVTHDRLVARAVRWLRCSRRGRSGCGVAVPELVSYCSEQPDAIGWANGALSTMVECKVSRADFMADRKKPRQEYGVGQFRFYLCPAGMISADELPDGWGLLYYHAERDRVTIEVDAPRNERRNMRAEISMMYSLLRRVEVRGELTRCLSPKWGGDFNSVQPDKAAEAQA